MRQCLQKGGNAGDVTEKDRHRPLRSKPQEGPHGRAHWIPHGRTRSLGCSRACGDPAAIAGGGRAPACLAKRWKCGAGGRGQGQTAWGLHSGRGGRGGASQGLTGVDGAARTATFFIGARARPGAQQWRALAISLDGSGDRSTWARTSSHREARWTARRPGRRSDGPGGRQIFKVCTALCSN